MSEKPTITDQIAVERYINNNTNVSFELKDDKKDKEGETKANENEKENVSLSKYNSLNTTEANNEGATPYSSEVVKTNNAGINIPVDTNTLNNNSIAKSEESTDKKDKEKKNKDSKKKDKKCLIF